MPTTLRNRCPKRKRKQISVRKNVLILSQRTKFFEFFIAFFGLMFSLIGLWQKTQTLPSHQQQTKKRVVVTDFIGLKGKIPFSFTTQKFFVPRKFTDSSRTVKTELIKIETIRSSVTSFRFILSLIDSSTFEFLTYDRMRNEHPF